MLKVFNKTMSVVQFTYKPTGKTFILQPAEYKEIQYNELGDGVSNVAESDLAYDKNLLHIEIVNS